MKKFKPTPAEWRLIKQVALLGHDTMTKDITSLAGVQLEARVQVNVNDYSRTHLNAALITWESPIGSWADCDLFDKGKMYTEQFRAGVDLTDDGRGLFDFYIYNRYDYDHGDVAGNVLVDVVDGKMARIWIEAGKPYSWTPERGIERERKGRL